MKRENYITTQTVIVGSGVAGLFTALCLPDDEEILIITKENLKDADSYLAQGGVCVLKNVNDYKGFFASAVRRTWEKMRFRII